MFYEQNRHSEPWKYRYATEKEVQTNVYPNNDVIKKA